MFGKPIPLLLVLALAGPVLALEPPTRAEIEQYRRNGTFAARLQNALAFGNHLTDPRLVRNLRTRLERREKGRDPAGPGHPLNDLSLPSGRQSGLPAKGNVKVFALLIDFPDYPAVNSAPVIASKLFGDGDAGYPYESLRNYYRRSSYNMLEIGGATLGWYRAPYPRAGMAMTSAARQALIMEALTHFDSLGHDFAPYDNDSNGAIDYFIVVWAGPNNGWGNFWWGYQTTFTDPSFQLDGKRFYYAKYSWQWESRNWPGLYDQIVVMHETGHALGLPDYYDYDAAVGPRGGVGGLDMMDANRGDHNCFSKMLLDWITPEAFNFGTRGFALGASGASPNALLAMPEFDPAKPFDEFFMIQNRTRTANDAALSADGLVVWHVDARLNTAGTNFKYDNSYTEHKLLRLMEADGLEQIERGQAYNPADYFNAGSTFSPATTPDSNRYDGTAPGLTLCDIGPAGATMALNTDIHYTLLQPEAGSITRLESDFVFFREFINKLTWVPNSRNRTEVVKYRIWKKPKSSGNDAYVYLADAKAQANPVFEHRGLKKDDTFTYRIIAVDKNGVESAALEVGQ
jgi:M6 family metalloprotease-like protein